MSRRCESCGSYVEEKKSLKWKSRIVCGNCGFIKYDRSEVGDEYFHSLPETRPLFLSMRGSV